MVQYNASVRGIARGGRENDASCDLNVGYEPLLFALDGKRYRAAVIEIGLGSSALDVLYRRVRR